MGKRILAVFLLLAVGVVFSVPSTAAAYNYGDYRSTTLITKAWKALEEKDLEAVLAYTNKCMELYANQAQKMQASLTSYPEGGDEEIFAYWALNDIATGLYIQAEAYRQIDMIDEAKAAYQKVIDDYSYGQCWDTGGWFWKPAEAAKEKLAMIESGSTLDFGDYRSATLATKAWEALAADDFDSLKAYVDKCIELYQDEAKKMQNSLTEYPWESKEKIFSYWALNDVGTVLFIQGEAYKKSGEISKAKDVYKRLVDEYYYAQCWDPNGWFWKPAEAAQQKIDELNEG